MKLYLLRHGEASARAETDAARPLTAQGEQDIRSVARLFGDTGLDHCLCSPYLRARQSATLFLATCGASPAPEISELLTPEAVPAALMHELDRFQPDNSVLLVSHNPLVSAFNALMTEGSTDNMHILATSELIGIELDHVGMGTATRILQLLPERQGALS